MDYVGREVERTKRNMRGRAVRWFGLAGVWVCALVYEVVQFAGMKNADGRAVAAVLGTLSVLAIATAIAASRHMRALRALEQDPESHSALLQLKRYGDPALLRQQIDLEVRSPVLRIESLTVTTSWFLLSLADVLCPIRIDDVMWAYRLTVERRLNGLTTQTAHTVQFATRNPANAGGITMSSKGVDALLQWIASNVPAVTVGYTKELEARYHQHCAQVGRA